MGIGKCTCYRMSIYIWATSNEKVSLNMRKMYRFRSSRACAKYHPGLCSPFIHSVVCMILLADSEGPDQTVLMRRLFIAFTAHIRPKTRFNIARPMFPFNKSGSDLTQGNVPVVFDPISSYELIEERSVVSF